MPLAPAPALLELCGSLVLGAFDGPQLTDADRALLARTRLGGVTLFARNVVDRTQLADLIDAVREASPGRAPIVAVDQEGGRVQRLRSPLATTLPEMGRVGDLGDPELARRLGALVGRELRAYGFDLDFAPVFDVHTHPDNPIIGRRAFGTTPELVARLGVAFARGLEDADVAACAKHFPGHGDTTVDSHVGLPVLAHDLARIEAVELVPFRAAIAAGVASIMTAHVVFRGLDAERPATLSPRAIDGLLRGTLGYDGPVFSDDLEMQAIADRWSIGEAAVQSLEAGCDLVLVCHRADRMVEAVEALVHAVEGGRLPRARVEQAARRADTLRRRGRERADRAALARVDDTEARALLSALT